MTARRWSPDPGDGVTPGRVDDTCLVVTDLDGTLWHTDGDIHPRTVTALHTLLDARVPVLVATGRRRTSTRGPLARIGVTPPAIVLNGALGLDLATDECFHCAPFPDGEASAVLEGFHDVGLEPCVYVDHPTVETFLGERPSTHPRHAASLAPAAAVADLAQVCATLPVLAFSIIGLGHDSCRTRCIPPRSPAPTTSSGRRRTVDGRPYSTTSSDLSRAAAMRAGPHRTPRPAAPRRPLRPAPRRGGRGRPAPAATPVTWPPR